MPKANDVGMTDPRMIGAAVVVGVLVFAFVIVPAVRNAAIENAPSAAKALAVSIDIVFPVGVAIGWLTRRELPAPVLFRKMIPVWAFCLGSLGLILLDYFVLLPRMTASFEAGLTNFVVTGGWLAPFLYWLVWPVIAFIAVLAVGMAGDYGPGRVIRSFSNRFG